MKYEGLKCDRCEALQAKPCKTEILLDGNANARVRMCADLCATCVSHVERSIRRAMGKPTPRAKKGVSNG